MAGLYFLHPDQFARLYNCNALNIDDVPLEQRQRPFLGTMCIVLFAVFELAYIPCMLAIRRHLDNSCYKIMFVMGIADIALLCLNGLQCGILSIEGAVYCSHPGFNYVTGMLNIFFWGIMTCSVTLLAINRCLDLALPSVADALFAGTRTWLCFVPIVAYSLYYGFWTKPIFWNPIGFYLDTNPYDGYAQERANPPETYLNELDRIHTVAVALLIPLIYAFFFVLIRIKHKTALQMASAESRHTVRMIFLQTLVIALIIFVNNVYFLVTSFVDVGTVLTICWSFVGISTNGFHAIIYLSMNKTIRNECKAICMPNWYSTSVPKTKTGKGLKTVVVAEARATNKILAV